VGAPLDPIAVDEPTDGQIVELRDDLQGEPQGNSNCGQLSHGDVGLHTCDAVDSVNVQDLVEGGQVDLVAASSLVVRVPHGDGEVRLAGGAHEAVPLLVPRAQALHHSLHVLRVLPLPLREALAVGPPVEEVLLDLVQPADGEHHGHHQHPSELHQEVH